MATVKLEVLPWLTRIFDRQQGGRMVREEEVEPGATVRDLFQRLTERYPAFGELVYDTRQRELTGLVSVIINDRILELVGGLDTEIHHGDCILLLPAYAGGEHILS